MGQAGVRPSQGLALPRGSVAAVYDCRIGGPSGAHRDAATATARQRAIRKKLVVFVVEESTLIFKWRGFAVSKKDHQISLPTAGGH